MADTGTGIVTAALQELGVLDPTATAAGTELNNGLKAGIDLIGTWRTKRLLVSGVTINTYSLVDTQQSYTIGSGGDFDQVYPQRILRWSVIPDDDADDPQEIPRGEPVGADVWQRIMTKSLEGPYPSVLYYDRAYSAGLGNCLFYPIPDNDDVDVLLHCHVPEITTLVAATSYDLPPGYARALKLALALELSDRYGSGATVTPDLKERAKEAMAAIKGVNITWRESPMRSEFAIGARGATGYDITTDGGR